MDNVSPETWKMLKGRRSNASCSGRIRTWANCPGCTSGEIFGARTTSRKHRSVSRSLEIIWTVCSTIVVEHGQGSGRCQRWDVASRCLLLQITGVCGLGWRPNLLQGLFGSGAEGFVFVLFQASQFWNSGLGGPADLA